MKDIYVVTYCDDPKDFDIVRLVKVDSSITVFSSKPSVVDKIVETDLLATSDKDSFQSFGKKRFYSPAVWKKAKPVKNLAAYKNAKQFTAEFKDLVKGK